MVRNGYYSRVHTEGEYKVRGIPGELIAAEMVLPGRHPWSRHGTFANYIGTLYTWLRPLDNEPEADAIVEAAASEPVYVYVACCKGVRGNTFTYSHTGEHIFNEHLAQIERQGATVVAKKRIKFNVN